MVVRCAHERPPQAHGAAARDVHDVLAPGDVGKPEEGMRLRVELTERPDVAAGRGVAAGVVQIDVEAGGSRRAPGGGDDPAPGHRTAETVVAPRARMPSPPALPISTGPGRT